MRRLFSCRYKIFLLIFLKFSGFFEGCSSQIVTQIDHEHLNTAPRIGTNPRALNEQGMLAHNERSCMGKLKVFFLNLFYSWNEILSENHEIHTRQSTQSE